MLYRILTKNGVDNTNIDGARNYNFNAGRRSGIVKDALNGGNFFASNNNTIALDTCELRLCGHRIVLDAVEYKTLLNIPSVPIRYSMIAQVIVDDNNDVSFDLIIQSSSTPLVQENLDTTGKGKFQLEIGKFTQLTDGTITDVVRTADLITGGGNNDSEYIRIGTVTTNKISPELDADVDIENTINPDDNKPQTNFTFNLPTSVGTVVSVNGEEKTSINTDVTPTANSQNLITSGGVFKYTNNISNPNLLINGDFRVNQRGKTSYVSDATIYTVDRWKTNISDKNISVTVVPQENGILLTYTSGSSGHSVLMQELETSDVLPLKGKILTLSYKITQITNSCRIRVLAGGNTTLFTETINESGTFSKSFEFPETATGLSVRIISNSTENTIGIEYIKLEVGSSATAFCPRPYAEELALCQRYNVDLIRNTTGYPYVAMGFARNATQLFVVLNLPQAMRVRPTVFVYEGLYLQGSNKSNELLTSSNVTFGGFATNGNQISLTITTTGLTAGQCYALQLRDNGHIGIDAEIY